MTISDIPAGQTVDQPIGDKANLRAWLNAVKALTEGAVQNGDARLTDARTPTAHTHALADTTGLVSALAAKAAGAQQIIAGLGLTGGGTLAADRTLAVDFAASGANSATKAVRADDSRLSDNRVDATAMHLAGTETVTGGKNFTGGLQANGNDVIAPAAPATGESPVWTGSTWGKQKHAPRTSLYLPGAAGNYASAPYAAALNITGNVHLRVILSMDTWLPAADQYLIGRYATSTNQRCWALKVSTTGQLQFVYSTSGTAGVIEGGPAPSVAASAILGVGVKVTADNGSSQHSLQFETSADEGATWSNLGSAYTAAGALAFFSSVTTPLEVGSMNVGASNPLAGRILKAEVRNGINGTVVASPDFTAPVYPRYSDAQGNIWTINGSANAWKAA